jgi:Leucine-rich repeat (LRR) protein
MAELAYALAGKILEKLGSLADKEISLVLDIKSELTELEGTMTTIQAVLLDAEEKQATSHPLSIWLRQLKDVFSDIEDVLDEVEYEVLKKQVMIRTYGRTRREVCRLLSCCSAFAFRSQLGHKTKDIREKLAKIAANKDQFNLIPQLEDRHVIHGRRRDMTHSFVPPSEVIGRDDDKKNIIHFLMGPDAADNDINVNVNVIPIVGIGGLGKTTIAKLVYDDERVANHFDLRMWVCVSEHFDVNRLIKDILKSATGANIDETLGVDLWQTRLRNCLKNKKFLLVLDDVWNEDRSKWIELKGLLSGGSMESKIVVTTRSRSVASVVKTGPIYTLKGLSHDDCLSLFVKWAFKEGEDKQYPNLLEIGKEIVKKCIGVPLAIRTLGNLLFSKVDEWEWKFVRDNGIWKLEQNESDILPALKLSYDQMSSHLKQCFAFCSLFPKDHLFDSGELIAFWMAHGLLNKTPNSQILELEDVGDMYIKELLSKSFFQDVTNATWYYRFKMHDLVHDLALKVAEEECLTVDLRTHTIAGTIHHLSFSHNDQQVPNYVYTLSRGVRTTLFQVKQQVPTLVEACISRFKYLRVLDLSDSSFEVLSSSIGTLKHLRSLNLAGNTRIKKLPNSICELYNLQTLLLRGCESLEGLPKDTRKLISLRYLTVTTTCESLFENDAYSLSSLRFLGIFGCERLVVLFQGMNGSLTNLRTLVVSDCKSLTSLIVKHR